MIRLGGLVGLLGRSRPASARRRRRVALATARAIHRVIGPSARRDRRERRQQQLEHALGIAADDQQRQQQLEDHDERGDR